MPFNKVYPHYITKAEKKGRTKEEVDLLINWLTGYKEEDIVTVLENDISFRDFFEHAPSLNPNRYLITGSVCGIKVQEVKDPLMQNIRYLDKLIDELAKNKPLDKILRKPKEV
jgi:hypothetical protein